MKCPICSSTDKDLLLSLNCGNLDGSSLYEVVNVVSCTGCGHVSNLLTEDETTGVMRYYSEEYSQNNIFSPNKTGDIPGSTNANSINRYNTLFNNISGFLKEDSMVLDIGCAAGGFLNYLKDKGCKNLYGLEFSKTYVKKAEKIDGLIIKEGVAEDIPFTEKFDIIIADQVVEHLFDPGIIFSQAKKVLKPGGIVCISVPNARLYEDNFFFDFYWFLMREHVQHFDFDHLKDLASKFGFLAESVSYSTTPMLSDEVTLPNMTVLFKLYGRDGEVPVYWNTLINSTKKYIDKCYQSLANRKIKIDKIVALNEPLCIWGVSREFMYLYKNTNLKNCNIVALVDDTPHKQTRTFMGMKIMSSSEISNLPEGTNMLITAFAHKDTLRNELKSLNFRGKVII